MNNYNLKKRRNKNPQRYQLKIYIPICVYVFVFLIDIVTAKISMLSASEGEPGVLVTLFSPYFVTVLLLYVLTRHRFTKIQTSLHIAHEKALCRNPQNSPN
jgi:uncharacterized membrane-anchored protein YitT (DUF2179 family)